MFGGRALNNRCIDTEALNNLEERVCCRWLVASPTVETVESWDVTKHWDLTNYKLGKIGIGMS